MNRIHYLRSSLFGHDSVSNRLADEFLRVVLGLLGITDVESIYAEGLNMGDKARSASLAEARSAISMLATDRTLEVSHEAA